MFAPLRDPFNQHYSEALFHRYRDWLTEKLGGFPFRLAETPLFFPRSLVDHLGASAIEIAEQLSRPATLAALKHAIPPHYNAPGMTDLPDCVQVDFAIVQMPDGTFEGRVVELQAFPSLYALETIEADAWAEVLSEVPGMGGELTCFFSEDRAKSVEIMRSCIVGDNDPSEVVLVDFQPAAQKTLPDFIATRRLFGIDSVCVTALEKEGRKLFRRVDGKRVPIARIYNRMVFDELEQKQVAVPFSWTDELDVSWCSHPNWYWTWSKFSLPHVDHPTVPKARYLSEFSEWPADLENYVLKPLFSFAGAGVIVDVTRAACDAVPAELRDKYLLQRKIDYAWTIRMPGARAGDVLGAHNAVKAEVRVMLMRAGAGQPLVPLLPLVRLSRGKMLGVDQNKSAETAWTGGSVGLWLAGR